MGGDASSIFRQKTIFSKITSKDFQSRYPCYLYVPHLSSDFSIHTGIPSVVNDDCRFLVASIMQYVEEAQKPKIDRNRIYLTGLSKGGSIAFELPAYYPGVFAASVPVSTFMNEKMVPNDKACNYWLLCNKTSFVTKEKKQALERLAIRLLEGGGCLKVSAFPGEGHNAWDKAWSEQAVWDWMFSHSLNQVCKASHSVDCGLSLISEIVKCESNIDSGNGINPYNVVDGLSSTYFASPGRVVGNVYWKCEFKKPQSGRWCIDATPDKKMMSVCGLAVLLSRDGKKWRRVGVVRKTDRIYMFSSSSRFRFLKVQREGLSEGFFVLRQLYRRGN